MNMGRYQGHLCSQRFFRRGCGKIFSVMHTRRFACLLLGIWFAGGVFMQWISTQNYRVADRLLDQPNPAASLEFKVLGPAATRQLLRYQVAEENRYYFEAWETVQVMLGAFFFFFLLF